MEPPKGDDKPRRRSTSSHHSRHSSKDKDAEGSPKEKPQKVTDLLSLDEDAEPGSPEKEHHHHHHHHSDSESDGDKKDKKEKKHHHKKKDESGSEEDSDEEKDEFKELAMRDVKPEEKDEGKRERRSSHSRRHSSDEGSSKHHTRRQTTDGRMTSPRAEEEAVKTPASAVASPSHQRRFTFAQGDKDPMKSTIDALTMLKKGTPFLKYGRRGFPHFRQFQLSEDNTKLIWYSKNKKMDKTQIDLAEVDDIVLGQTTPVFERHLTPELDSASFSLLYHGRKRSLDLIAKNSTEFKVWTEGLRQLCHKAKSASRAELETIKEIPVEVPTTGPKPPSQPPPNAAGAAAPPPLSVNPIDGPDSLVGVKSSEKMEKHVRKELEETRKKMQRLDRQSRETKIYVSSQYNRIQETLKKAEQDIQAVQGVINAGDFNTADHDIWQIGVNLKTLDHMMAALEV